MTNRHSHFWQIQPDAESREEVATDSHRSLTLEIVFCFIKRNVQQLIELTFILILIFTFSFIMEEVEVKHYPEVAEEESAKPDLLTENDNDHDHESDDSSSNHDELTKKSLEQTVRHHEQFNMREIIIYLPGGSQMRFNPFTSMFAIVVLWGLAIWCMVAPEGASTTIIEWKARVTELFTWFYVGTNPVFMVRTKKSR